jgi:hypothetical protein
VPDGRSGLLGAGSHIAQRVHILRGETQLVVTGDDVTLPHHQQQRRLYALRVSAEARPIARSVRILEGLSL